MSDRVSEISADLAEGIDASKAFIGEFLYEPLGIEASEALMANTFYTLVAFALFFIYRVTRPAPRSRAKRRIKYDYGRNV
ncbi:MAG: hypothetical protein AAGI50_17920 [Pseudomonadota bacterium]